MKNSKTLTVAALMSSCTLGHAALSAIANGDFESDVVYNLGASAPGVEPVVLASSDSSVGSSSGADWFELGLGTVAPLSFRDFINNTDSPVNAAIYRPNGNILTLNNAASYIYQNLGTLDEETGASFTFDAFERIQANGDFTATIELFSSSSGAFTAANGTDVKGASGVTALGFGSYNFVSDDDLSTDDDVIGASIPNLSLVGANVGDDIWVRVSTPRPSTDAVLSIDNLAVTYAVPEPGSAVLLGLGCLSLLFRRRN